jgi:hypothetical protein
MRRNQLWLIFVLLIVVAGAVIWVSRELPRRVAAEVGKPKEKEIDLLAVVTRVRGLNRLETASMHVVHVGTVTQSYAFVPNALAGDSLTLMATGDVIAGVDLELLKPGDIYRRADGTVVIRLPAPQVLVTRINNRESHVTTRNTGFLRHPDSGLEGRARLYAESGIRNEAINQGILKLAGQNAQARIAELLHSAGIGKVEFVEVGGGVPTG